MIWNSLVINWSIKLFVTGNIILINYFFLSQDPSSYRGEDCAAAEAPGDLAGGSRTERMHQLRAEHQRRHAQRNRTYPSDGAEHAQDQVGNVKVQLSLPIIA